MIDAPVQTRGPGLAVAGGALVLAVGYRTLFALTGLVALITAIGVSLSMPPVASTSRRLRAGMGTLVQQMRRGAIHRPVPLLAAGTAALSAGVPNRRAPKEPSVDREAAIS